MRNVISLNNFVSAQGAYYGEYGIYSFAIRIAASCIDINPGVADIWDIQI